ncbi:T9SS type A sorting domain-containing protein [Yeosuana marina]|uniref:T9SS type A sorting domain-containing protein n=1 Tax=Yeosuana marina TaxID=1565536 RepID=UPI0030EC04ED|tara:strand:+ start:683 stop:3181 length:2499 start_codon:yes stop_codon:yes gene_type:complete
MKTKLPLLISFFFYINLYAQINFQERSIINNTYTTEGLRSVYSADIDGDGDMDMVTASLYDNKIAWYENTNGQGDFYNTQNIITTNALGAIYVYAADIDNDGDLDVLSASAFDDKIAWYENIDGHGNFGSQQIISTNMDYPVLVYAVDIDGDGDMDVISSSTNDNKLAWYENTDGQGVFGSQNIITSSGNGATQVNAADFDGDGDMDILSVLSYDDKIVWYENTDGQGSFGVQKNITTIGDGASSVYTIDIDGDGDTDVISGSNNTSSAIGWYKNDGLGNFSAKQIIASNTDVDGVILVYGSDVDNDQDIDLISFSYRDSKIAWFENIDGQGNFSLSQTITQFYFKSSIYINYVSILTDDIDSDGDFDLVFSSSELVDSTSLFDKVAWYENKNGQGGFNIQHVINSNAYYPMNAYAADLDGDGDLDVLSASRDDDKIAWYENIDGLGNFSTQKIIIENANSAHCVHAVDIDNDGDMDIVSASWDTDEILWFENLDGQGVFSTQKIVTSLADGASYVYSSDIDNDGDMDLLSASYLDDKIAWYENTDGHGSFGGQQIISSNANGAVSVYTTDLDNDGDMDVLSASQLGDNIAWYENTDGQGNFSGQHIISSNVNGPSSIYAIDIDNDGDMDIISSSYLDNKIAWYENTDGHGSFGVQQIISSNANGASSVYATDIDNDGDMDVLSSSQWDKKVAWYENIDGKGTFGVQQIISSNADGASSVYAIDIDNDGEIDVISTSKNDDKIAWYKSSGTLSITENDLSKLSVYPNPTNGILNIKSKLHITKLEVYNNIGQVVLSVFNNKAIDISILKPGLYFIRIKDGIGNSETKKIIKE